MKIILKTFYFSLLLILLFQASVTFGASSISEQAQGGFNTAVDEVYGRDVKVDENTFNQGLITIINALLTFTGIIFLLLIIYAGYLWMNARGSQEQIDKAKKITREAVIGLLLIILARIFTEFILTQIGNAAK